MKILYTIKLVHNINSTEHVADSFTTSDQDKAIEIRKNCERYSTWLQEEHLIQSYYISVIEERFYK